MGQQGGTGRYHHGGRSENIMFHRNNIRNTYGIISGGPALPSPTARSAVGGAGAQYGSGMQILQQQLNQQQPQSQKALNNGEIGPIYQVCVCLYTNMLCIHAHEYML